jgi:hypothetical protein
VGAAGVVAFAYGLSQGSRARSLSREVEDACRMGCTWTPELQQKQTDGKRAQTLSYLLGVGGGLVAAAGAGYALWSKLTHPALQPPPREVAVALGPGGAALTFARSF